jgi:hypothetical protein
MGPAAFIPFCLPSVSQRPQRGRGWAHELKHDGYRLQIHVRDGRVRLYTMNADWSKRYPLIVQDAARNKGSAILDTEAVWLNANGAADFEALHRRACNRLRLRSSDAQRRRFVAETVCGAESSAANSFFAETARASNMWSTQRITATSFSRLSASLALRGLSLKE